MCMLWLLVLVNSLSLSQGWWFFRREKQVCYRQYGCFSNAAPFTNTNGRLPESSSTTFYLHTRNSIRHGQVFWDSTESIQHSNFQKEAETKVIIHGYIQNGFEPWIKEMTAEFLKKEDVNVIVVNWQRGALDLVYHQAAANARLVAAQISRLLKMLNNVYGTDPASVHILGHSLGAHIAGYVGERTPGLGRITGLDPAGPLFEDTDERVHLDGSDARIVDVIHTDTKPLWILGLGIQRPSGTVDFYPNGGMLQPGCTANLLEQTIKLFFSGELKGLKRSVLCSHERSVSLFISSINRCNFPACQVKSIYDARTGHCKTPPSEQSLMGYAADQTPPGLYYVSTPKHDPYC